MLGHWHEQTASTACDLLEQAAARPEGLAPSDLRALRADVAEPYRLGAVLSELEDAGYLRRESGRWSFTSELLRRYWLVEVTPWALPD